MFGHGYGKKAKTEQDLMKERVAERLKQEKAQKEAQQVVEPVKFEAGSCEDSFFKSLASCCNVIGYLVTCCGCCSSWDKYNGHTDPSEIDWNSPN